MGRIWFGRGFNSRQTQIKGWAPHSLCTKKGVNGGSGIRARNGRGTDGGARGGNLPASVVGPCVGTAWHRPAAGHLHIWRTACPAGSRTRGKCARE